MQQEMELEALRQQLSRALADQRAAAQQLEQRVGLLLGAPLHIDITSFMLSDAMHDMCLEGTSVKHT